MRYILTALLLGIILASTAMAIEVGEYEIEIYGSAEGFTVVYRWLAKGPSSDYVVWVNTEPEDYPAVSIYCEGEISHGNGLEAYHYATARFHVDSFSEIRPTPAEMEARGIQEEAR